MESKNHANFASLLRRIPYLVVWSYKREFGYILKYTKSRINPLKLTIVSWCNGSTTGFGSVCRGSNPLETTDKVEEKNLPLFYFYTSPIALSENYCTFAVV